MTLTDQQMYTHWRRYRGLEPELSDCSVEMFEGADLTARLHVEMRQWYLDLLDHGDLGLLTLTDVASRLAFTPADAAGVWRAPLPPDVRRPVTLTLAGGLTVAVQHAGDPAVQRALMLANNPYSRQCAMQPLVYVDGGRTLTLVAAGSDSQAPHVLSAMAVVDPGDELYTMDESALGLLYGTSVKNANAKNQSQP